MSEAEDVNRLGDWPGDPKLAALNKRFNVKAPLEAVVRPEIFMTQANPDLVKKRKHIVRLACGHIDIAKLGAKRKRCTACQELIDKGADYDAFRHLKEPPQ